jgi:D-aspartate ligase
VRNGAEPIPAVVLKAGRHAGLGIVRTLGRMRVPVYVVDASRWAPAAVSRYAAGFFAWDVEAEPAETTRDFLLSLARRIGSGAVLFPTSDFGARVIAGYAAFLSPHYRFARTGAGLVDRLCSKKDMHFLARRAEIPVPHAVFPRSAEDVRGFARECGFPVMLKGIDGRRLQLQAGRRMFLVSAADELMRLYERHENPVSPNLMAQQYIPGDDGSVWMFNGYFDSASRCLAGATGSKIRQYPVSTGLTTLGACIANHEVYDLSCRFAQAIGYSGLLDIDYRYDARDGRYKILDVNPRTGATFRLFAHPDGFDVVRAAYQHLTGAAVKPRPLPDGRRWLVEDIDFLASLEAMRRGAMPAGAWLSSVRGVDETALLSADDPLPAAASLAANGAAGIRRLCSRLCVRPRTTEAVIS